MPAARASVTLSGRPASIGVAKVPGAIRTKRIPSELMWEGPVGNWIAACDRILAMDIETVVPGHGPVGDRRIIEDVADYLALVPEQPGRGRPGVSSRALSVVERADLRGARRQSLAGRSLGRRGDRPARRK